MAVSKTRAKLVDVARQLFAKNGVDDTTMNDIAVASKKGRRTLYTYFKSKEDIYMAVRGCVGRARCTTLLILKKGAWVGQDALPS
jgi:AcrR family transcriptional regulator